MLWALGDVCPQGAFFLWGTMKNVFSFLKPLIEGERAGFLAKGEFTEEGAQSALDLLEKRLINLVDPIVSQMYTDELYRIVPAAIIGLSFVSNEDKEKARDEVIRRINGGENPFSKYPDLDYYRRLICDNFQIFIDTFLKRFSLNSERIQRELLGGCRSGKITGLSASGADCHLHGCSALKVETEGGVFYYKPRDCRPDELFYRLADRFFSGKIRAPFALSVDGEYGFIEEIKSIELKNKEDIASFYYNFGILLSLFRCLGSTDMHFENIVASGIYPVCIDLETIITPIHNLCQGTDYKSIDEIDSIVKSIMFSSANTMVLPMVLQGKEQMSPLYSKKGGSLPIFDKEKQTIQGYEKEFMDGFSQGYDIIRENKKELTGLLDEYRNMSARFVLRTSSYYALTLQEMHSKEFLEDRKRRDRELDKLSIRLNDLAIDDVSMLTAWERSNLEEGDIPFFSMKADGHSLYGDPRDSFLIDYFFDISALEHAKLCLSNMGDDNKAFEMDYLRVRLLQAVDKAEKENDEPVQIGEADSPLTVDDAKALARELSEKISELKVAVSGKDAIFLSYDKNYTPQYSKGFRKGLQGIAVFFEEYLRTVDSDDITAGNILEICNEDTKRLLSRGESDDLIKLCDEGFELPDVVAALAIVGKEVACVKWAFEKVLSELDTMADKLFLDDSKETGYGMLKGKAGLLYLLSLCCEHIQDEKRKNKCIEKCSLLISELLNGYSKKLGAWPDIEKCDKPLFATCDLEKGVPGIGLMAAGSLRVVPQAKELLQLAADSISSYELLETDTLLNGNAGVVLCLLEAAKTFKNKSYLVRAGQFLKKMSERAVKNGGFRVLPGTLTGSPDPSLMDGYAGIGYALLRYIRLVTKEEEW